MSLTPPPPPTPPEKCTCGAYFCLTGYEWSFTCWAKISGEHWVILWSSLGHEANLLSQCSCDDCEHCGCPIALKIRWTALTQLLTCLFACFLCRLFGIILSLHLAVWCLIKDGWRLYVCNMLCWSFGWTTSEDEGSAKHSGTVQCRLIVMTMFSMMVAVVVVRLWWWLMVKKTYQRLIK